MSPWTVVLLGIAAMFAVVALYIATGFAPDIYPGVRP
jgi:ABC-type antimicrobial peptide transport system permease subunit